MPLKERHDRIATAKEATENKPAQEAVTTYKTVSKSELPISAGKYPTSRFSLVRVSPQTGRRHQIRRHLKHIAHPIIGDIKHGDHKVNQLIEREFAIRRLLLVASRLSIKHPSTDEIMQFSATHGEVFDRALVELQLRTEQG